MRVKDVVIGEYYKVVDSPYYYAKAIQIHRPRPAYHTNATVIEKMTKRILIECEYVVDRGDTIGRKMYFSSNALIKIK